MNTPPTAISLRVGTSCISIVFGAAEWEVLSALGVKSFRFIPHTIRDERNRIIRLFVSIVMTDGREFAQPIPIASGISTGEILADCVAILASKVENK